MIGATSNTRRFISAVTSSSLKTGMLGLQQAARSRVFSSTSDNETPYQAKAESHVRAQNQALLNIADAQAMLTTVEDSLETIADVLGEMQTIASEAEQLADEPQSGSPAGGSGGRGRFWGWFNENWGDESDELRMSNRRSKLAEDLKDRSDEIDAIVQDTRFGNSSLLSDQDASFALFVNLREGDTLEVTFEAIGANQLAVSHDDLDIEDKNAARTTREGIESAIETIQQRLSKLSDIKDRLVVKYDTLKTSRSIHETSLMEVDDAETARVGLEQTKLRIIEDANLAVLAQANTSASSIIQLVDDFHRTEDASPFARIYSLDGEHDGGPVTPLRRIMLGHGPRQTA